MAGFIFLLPHLDSLVAHGPPCQITQRQSGVCQNQAGAFRHRASAAMMAKIQTSLRKDMISNLHIWVPDLFSATAAFRHSPGI